MTYETVTTDAGSRRLVLSVEQIPEDMRRTDRWVVWRFDRESDKTSPSKVPHNYQTGRKCNPHLREHRGSLPDVVAAYDAGGWDGIGFVFNEDDDIVGLDLDDVRDPISGQLDFDA